MNTSTSKPKLQKRVLGKSIALSSLFALVAVPIAALAGMIYGTPIMIDNPTPTEYDQFGSSVSIDGGKFIVGAPEDDIGTYNAGSAYLYDATTGALLQTFNNPTPLQDERFGNSVSISGDKVLIGSAKDGIGGSAYLYDATTGALLQTFNNPTNPTPSSIDAFGTSVAISGDKVLIGAPGDSVAGYNEAGSAYLYDANTGFLLQTFNNPTPWAYEYDRFGESVSISGDKVLIGVAFKNTMEGADTGSAYLYDATTGALLQTFNNPTPMAGDHFGESVSLSSSDKVWIGASGDDTGALNAGSAYLYDATTGVLLKTFNSPTPASNNSFGRSISISGDKALFSEAGSAYLYDANTGSLLRTFNKGGYVSLSEDKVLIGEPFDDSGAVDAGSAYLYLPLPDTDGDGIEDGADNCPADYNPDQDDNDADGIGNACDPTPDVAQLTALDPAKVWIGIKNSDDAGIKFDLLAEAYVDTNLVSSGTLDSVPGGSSGFNNANLHTINFGTFAPVDFPPGSGLSLKVYGRNACVGSGKNSGSARLWYNDSAANSRFGTTIEGAQTDRYLVTNFKLSNNPGIGPKLKADINAGATCSPYTLFGTWSMTP